MCFFIDSLLGIWSGFAEDSVTNDWINPYRFYITPESEVRDFRFSDFRV